MPSIAAAGSRDSAACIDVMLLQSYASRRRETTATRRGFRLKLKDFDLADPQSKRAYNREVFSMVAPRYGVIRSVLSFGRDERRKCLFVEGLPALAHPAVLEFSSSVNLALRRLQLSLLRF